ncbi:hypothetical protein CLOSAC_03110 [Clostridium saccharobutylicum]|uniref:Uncharacterized protein n=2 Tax=Clostridium saccharobutylicum TaxID=169679 RepID=A0A1S8NHX7_CLOSA|nr:hypothetical protein CLOSAC_03110 [Clostridium saccharobutylicum]
MARIFDNYNKLKGSDTMKKSTAIFLTVLFLTVGMIKVSPLAQANNLKEGFYKMNDLNLEPNKEYDIQNLSPSSAVYILVFDKNNVVQQSLRLQVKSGKYKLSPLPENYTIAIVGDGDVSIS